MEDKKTSKKLATSKRVSKFRIDDNGRECTKCGEYKEWGMYSPSALGAKGKRASCKECCSARSKEYREANPEKVKQSWARYRDENIEDLRAAWKTHRGTHADERNQYSRGWRATNKQKVKELNKRYYSDNRSSEILRGREYRAANKGKMRALYKTYKQEHPHKVSEHCQ